MVRAIENVTLPPFSRTARRTVLLSEAQFLDDGVFSQFLDWVRGVQVNHSADTGLVSNLDVNIIWTQESKDLSDVVTRRADSGLITHIQDKHETTLAFGSRKAETTGVQRERLSTGSLRYAVGLAPMLPGRYREGADYRPPALIYVHPGSNTLQMLGRQGPAYGHHVLDIEADELWGGYAQSRGLANYIWSHSRFSTYGLTAYVSSQSPISRLTLRLPEPLEMWSLFVAQHGLDPRPS